MALLTTAPTGEEPLAASVSKTNKLLSAVIYNDPPHSRNSVWPLSLLYLYNKKRPSSRRWINFPNKKNQDGNTKT